MRVSMGVALLLALAWVLVIAPGPASGRGATTWWYTYGHGHWDQKVTGGITSGYLRKYGWSTRLDFASPYSLTHNLDVGFLWDASPALGLLSNRFISVTAHYRWDAPRLRVSLFGGYGDIRMWRSATGGQLWSHGWIVGADVQYELRNRWLLSGSAAWGPAWTVVDATTTSTYMNYRASLAIPLRGIPNAYLQLSYRRSALAQLPAFLLCTTPPCRIDWGGQVELGFLFASRQAPAERAGESRASDGLSGVRGAGWWYSFNHWQLRQRITGGPSGGYLRTYELAARRDFPSAFSLGLNLHTAFLWGGSGSLETMSARLFSITGHHRFEAPRRRLSVFVGYGGVQVETSTLATHLSSRGVLLGVDAQIEGRDGWLVTGAIAWGPGWRTTAAGAAATGTFLDYRVTLSIPVRVLSTNAYAQLGWRGISLTQVPGSILCSTPPCRIDWRGYLEIGLLFVSR